MDKTEEGKLTIFWSWQDDSRAWSNRNFIGDCLERAASAVQREDTIIISVDRDTAGVGGSPLVTDAILEKIRSADVFVWDATLIYKRPRPAPNPNVLLELGYALAILGDRRLIGVMNTAGAPSAEQLPFDLRNRRWPLTYALRAPPEMLRLVAKRLPWLGKQYLESRERTRKELVNDLKNAIRDALNEPKEGAVRSDVDFHAARRLWTVINSHWLADWHEWRIDHPQYEHAVNVRRIWRYIGLTKLPEYEFSREGLKLLHDQLLDSLRHYSQTAAVEMIPQGLEMYVISAKVSDWSAEVEKHYERQCSVLAKRVDEVWSSWQAYVAELRFLYPEIVDRAEPVT